MDEFEFFPIFNFIYKVEKRGTRVKHIKINTYQRRFKKSVNFICTSHAMNFYKLKKYISNSNFFLKCR